MNKRLIALIAVFVMLTAFKKEKHTEHKKDILSENADRTVNPADDFFDYANGNWIKHHTIPPDESSYGISQLVQEELYNRLRHINEEAIKQKNPTGITQQIAYFWYAGMDSDLIERMRIAPLHSELMSIAGQRTRRDLMVQAIHMHTYGVNVFFDDDVEQDAKESNINAFYLTQGGLGLPNRDYYFNTDPRTTQIRNAYPAYISTIFTLMGVNEDSAKEKAKRVIALETKLASESRRLEDLRDPYKNYNKIAISNLSSLTPHIAWNEYLRMMGVIAVDTVIVGQPEFYRELDTLMENEDMQTLKDYMSFHLVRSFAPYMSKQFAMANFNFYNKLIRGAQEPRPRWKRVLDAEETAIGEGLGQLFVKEYFNAAAKKRYETIVENVRAAYKARMEKLDWMTDSTKRKALHKLAVMHKKVGYPDKWKDFSSMRITANSFVQNMMSANIWWNIYELNKLGKPVDRSEWDMTPQTYNAYYNPSNNEIVLPAGIFTVPGYKDAQLDDGLVYGYAAASTIGHEITHGFDDEGRQFDENGNLRDWWTSEDEEQFNKRAKVLADQFSKMVVVDTLHINGQASLGENLADLGGLLIGFDAFKKTDFYKNGVKIDGFTPAQRFFLGYALGWLTETRKEQLAAQVLTDVHAPAKFRVNGPMPNVPAFYKAFDVKPGNNLYLPDSLQVHLW